MGKQFHIILTGKRRDGFDQGVVQDSLATLFQINEEKARQILSGKPNTLKNIYAEEKAQSLRNKLLGIGVECILRVAEDGEPEVGNETSAKRGKSLQPNNDPSREIVNQKENPYEKPQVQPLSHETNKDATQKSGEVSNFPLPVKIAIAGFALMALNVLVTFLFFGNGMISMILLFASIFLFVVWALIRAYRLGWVVGVIIGAGWPGDIGIILASPELEVWRAINVCLGIVVFIALLMPPSLKRLRLRLVSKTVGRLPLLIQLSLPVLLILPFLAQIDNYKRMEGERQLVQNISHSLTAVASQQSSYRQSLGTNYRSGFGFKGDWPTGHQLVLENLEYGDKTFSSNQYISSATFSEGRVIEVKFTKKILNGASIKMQFNQMGILSKCHTDTVPGKYIQPNCINCVCDASSSSIQ
ncbi:MAG: hypothetical protein R8M38_05965 [Mariprofundaceae bacterium]